MNDNIVILGGGITGLAIGLSSSSHLTIEAKASPGGICGSYYIGPNQTTRHTTVIEDEDFYRFEYGGGHWIFGGDPVVLQFLEAITPTRSYARSSAVYFPDEEIYVPYPIQNHLSCLGNDIAAKVITEITDAPKGIPGTMADWLIQNFGPTLTEKFFGPFHELYTAGLWTQIAPQDAYKSPVNTKLVVQGAFEHTLPVGYNTRFIYPVEGLNVLAQRMANFANVQYNRRVAAINPNQNTVDFVDGTGIHYETLISTLPLNRMTDMVGLSTNSAPDPYTSVLVVNIGAIKGDRCPSEHWLYIPYSKSGFHRVGFYSNVDDSFLPASSRESGDRVSIYVERAYRSDCKPTPEDIETYCKNVVQELQAWGFIKQTEVVDPTWIDVAYTWSMSGSQWKTEALSLLQKNNIYQVGRYGRWIFQGIADSIRDGFIAGSSFRSYP